MKYKEGDVDDSSSEGEETVNEKINKQIREKEEREELRKQREKTKAQLKMMKEILELVVQRKTKERQLIQELVELLRIVVSDKERAPKMITESTNTPAKLLQGKLFQTPPCKPIISPSSSASSKSVPSYLRKLDTETESPTSIYSSAPRMMRESRALETPILDHYISKTTGNDSQNKQKGVQTLETDNMALGKFLSSSLIDMKEKKSLQYN